MTESMSSKPSESVESERAVGPRLAIGGHPIIATVLSTTFEVHKR